MPKEAQPKSAKQAPYVASIGTLSPATRRSGRRPKNGVRDLENSLRRAMPEWLYNECIEVLDSYLEDRYGDNFERPPCMDTEKAEALRKIIRSNFGSNYPPRPSEGEKLPEGSQAVIKLRECLSNCPDLKSMRLDREKEYPNLELHEDGRTYSRWYELSKSYKQEIVTCLEAVEKQHGDKGRRLANWEVRDQVAQRVRGITYSSEAVYQPLDDESRIWLEKEHPKDNR